MVRLKKRKENIDDGFRKEEKSDFNDERLSEPFSPQPLDNLIRLDESPKNGVKTGSTSILSSSMDKSETKKALSKPWLRYPAIL